MAALNSFEQGHAAVPRTLDHSMRSFTCNPRGYIDLPSTLETPICNDNSGI